MPSLLIDPPDVNPLIGPIKLVDREQLRFKLHGRRCSVPRYLAALMPEIPPAPAKYDFSKNESIKMPILGNDQYGCCYYAWAAHQVQLWTGNAKEQVNFDRNALVKRYLQLSPRDNGLSDSQIFPEFKRGIIGPNGPWKIFEELTIKPSDIQSLELAMWVFCGVGWTFSLGRDWHRNAGPGVVWTPNNMGSSIGGHAVGLSGKVGEKLYDVRTWGISPPVRVTHDAILASDSEIIVCFSLDMFSAEGVAPCGANYDQCAQLWVQMGGNQPPKNPFPPAPPLDWLISP